MIKFKNFIQEYLTKDQLDHVKQANYGLENGMTPEARIQTDHFFGEGVDEKTEYPDVDARDKSEIHQKIEKHTGLTISHADYRLGTVQDPKYSNRRIRITKLIPNELHKEYAADKAKIGSKTDDTSRMYATIHRGFQVAGQTNAVDVPDKEGNLYHHSWTHSCKRFGNPETDYGKNSENELDKPGLNAQIAKYKEPQHGSVVAFIHDHRGREIARATFHPFHETGNKNNVLYKINSLYGDHHPHKQYFENIAERLSHNGQHINDGSIRDYKLHKSVYNNEIDDYTFKIHADTPEQIEKAFHKTDDSYKKSAILDHPDAPSSLLDHVINSKKYNREHEMQASRHKNLSQTTLNSMVDNIHDLSTPAVSGITKNPTLTSNHISRLLASDALKTEHIKILSKHKSFNSSHLGSIIDSPKKYSAMLYEIIADHPLLNNDQAEKVLSQNHNYFVNEKILQNPALHHSTISGLIEKHKNSLFHLQALSRNLNLNDDHIKSLLESPVLTNQEKRSMIQDHPGIKKEHLIPLLNHDDDYIPEYAKNRLAQLS